jgi:hypothetical protein
MAGSGPPPQAPSKSNRNFTVNAPIDQAAVSLGMAALMGACIGFERQWRQRMAGLRTNTLVAITAQLTSASKNDGVLEQVVGRSVSNRPFRRQAGVSSQCWNNSSHESAILAIANYLQ